MRYIFTLVCLLASNAVAFADKHYCLLFAYDSKPVPLPMLCHIWGTYVKTDDSKKIREVVTISWEPLKHDLFDRRRTAQNIDLKDTLDFAVRKRRKIRVWGPFATTDEFFTKAKNRLNEEGRYKFIDGCWRGTSQNCIHRISDIAGYHRTGFYWGWWATDSVYKHYLRQGEIRPTEDREEVYEMLGLKCYNVTLVK
jgi:hypothetical protein